jgi:hypothetical protein
MKPELINNIKQPDQLGQVVNKIELGEPSFDASENKIGINLEKGGKAAEFTGTSNGVSITTTLPQPVDDDTNVVDSTTQSSFPALASDDDLIEKEWVDKAKKIISETKNNPYQQEEDVSKLQIDYLKKRYGKKIGDSGN